MNWFTNGYRDPPDGDERAPTADGRRGIPVPPHDAGGHRSSCQDPAAFAARACCILPMTSTSSAPAMPAAYLVTSPAGR